MKQRLLTPFQKFVKIEGLSGILLLGTTIIAMLWANSAYSDSYTTFWNFKLGIQTDSFTFTKPLILWINDGLMAIFFFLIGLEIKREILIGELNSLKKLAFPLAGAIGGIAVPVALFIILNQNMETFRGWGISMATDIAFSLAILNALGKRVPLSLKIFLTAFAIVDDLGAVLVIAIFYSGAINMILLSSAIAILALLYALSYFKIYSKFLLAIASVAVWFLFLKAGIHPTLAGVLLAFAVPLRQAVNTKDFVSSLTSITKDLENSKVAINPILSDDQLEHVEQLDEWTEKYQSPLQRLEHQLHNWVAYLIIPIFALANAGVAFASDVPIETMLVINIILCLVLGKSIGISALVIAVKKLKIIEVPDDLTNIHIIGVSFLAGIGFTMAIFIASLAFSETPNYIASAKIGILIGSLISAILGYSILRWHSSRGAGQEQS